ncbi:MAG: Major Facilitator Superfamily protein [Geminicoccaceae bacterium]|nr:Major Facilitator Superfamily protein [Geminicoccaceae bacterium]
MTAIDIPPPAEASGLSRRSRAPYAALVLIGLGGLFSGVTGPLLSNFIPPLVRDAVGDQRTIIGAIMAIDNVLLLALVPWAGPASDRATAGGRGRLPFVLAGFVLAALGMAALPTTAALGLPLLIGAIVLLHMGINLQRAPFQALVVDLVPSRFRSLATGSVTFQMCVGAIVFLMLGQMLGMQPAFLIAAITVLAIAAVFAMRLRETPAQGAARVDVTFRSLMVAAGSAVSGAVPGMRPIFVATLLLQLTFQSFTTWYALHAIERFGVRPEDATLGFIAWAVGGVIGALPAGVIGVRIGRRNAMLVGFALMAACLLALDRVTQIDLAIPLLALASASWTLPMVNSYPLFVEPVPREHRGVLASLFLLCMALGGAVGDPLNGRVFDLFDGYRALFLLMACYTALAFLAVLFIPRGAGEAGTGPESA